jgi:lysosomal acid lipase/cholesteryl ester hydrolase
MAKTMNWDDFQIQVLIANITLSANILWCQENSPTMKLCIDQLTMMYGQNKEGLELDTRIVPDYYRHMAHSASTKQANHYLQLVISEKFRQYDYKENNFKFYNASTPPDYKLKNVKASTYLYTGGCDGVISEIDIEHLKELLPNVKKHRSIRNYNHGDFNNGKNSRKILFNGILKDMMEK